MVTLRPFQPGDETPLVEAWNRSMPADPTTAGWFRDCVLLDPNFDPEGLRVAVTGDDVVGCAYAVRRLIPLAPGTDLEPDIGWIPFFFVVPEHRGGGLGRRLLQEAVTFLEGLGRTKVEFSSYTPQLRAAGRGRRAVPRRVPAARRAGLPDALLAGRHGPHARRLPDPARRARPAPAARARGLRLPQPRDRRAA
ncbi:GNAT family N-acetyltransferase [Nonomuraea salmonea]|uniref:GNAT family N-acetyltransferase n=1 Tax=Nonomuraea salmonea TaxID=46181 RepID=UPI0031E84367